MSKSTKITLDEWEQALSDAMGERAEDVPKSWITMDEFAARIKKGKSAASSDMRILLESDKAEKKAFRVERNGRIQSSPHYRLKKK